MTHTTLDEVRMADNAAQIANQPAETYPGDFPVGDTRAEQAHSTEYPNVPLRLGDAVGADDNLTARHGNVVSRGQLSTERVVSTVPTAPSPTSVAPAVPSAPPQQPGHKGPTGLSL